jgi:predicted dehydrogenase
VKTPSAATRREFLHTSARLALATTALPAVPTASGAAAEGNRSANDRPHILCVGTGGRGMAIANQAAKYGNIVAVCDADLNHANKARVAFGGTADVYQDYRKALEHRGVDVVVNATPDHWHTAINIAACQAGKDVYTEKPLTLTIDEGKRLCDVVAKTRRIVQVGTQQRSVRQFQTAVELVRNGRIGELQQVWVVLPFFSTQGGPFATQPVPKSLDWDLYQGQAPVRDYCLQRTHSNFRWWYEYAGGIITDWGNHHMDIAHWGMDCESTGPTSIEARGIFPNRGAADCYNTPDRFFSRMVYPNGVELLYFAALQEKLLYGAVDNHQTTTPEQVERLFGKEVPDEIKSYNRNGVMFVGARGRLFVNRGGVYGKAAEQLESDPLPADAWRVRPSRNHMADFFASFVSRAEPVSPVPIQHRTVTACHLTNISLRLGRPLQWDPQAQQILGDDEAQGWQQRAARPPYTVSI